MNRMNGPATPNLVRKRSASPSARSSMPLPTTSIGHRRSEEHTSELQSQSNLVCRLLLEKKKHEYVLFWEAPYVRIAYWNKFGMPQGYLSRFGDYTDAPGLWWIDPDKDAALRKAMADNNAKLPVGAVDDSFWQEYAKKHPAEESEGFTGSK